MSTLAELESEFERLTAIRAAANYERDPTVTEEKRIVLAVKHRAVHTQLFAARREAAAAQNPPAPEPEMIAVPTLAQLEARHDEFERMIQAVKSDALVSNEMKREIALERVALRAELIAARREVEEAEAAGRREAWDVEFQAMKSTNAKAPRHEEKMNSGTASDIF